MDTESARPRVENLVSDAARALRHRLVNTLADLVQIPSENTPPIGNELACQEYVQQRLVALGMDSEMYDIRHVRGLISHPAFRHQRDYADRPNVGSILKGSGCHWCDAE